MNTDGFTPAEAECLAAFRSYVARAYRDDFGVVDAAQIALAAEDWFHCDARHDNHFEEMEKRWMRAGDPQAVPRFLDLAAGMGTATLRGLQRGLDGYGIEPDAEKLALMRRRISVGVASAARSPAAEEKGDIPGNATRDFSQAWTARFARAVGEKLPYRDASFEAVLSYQTLEHVQDGDAVLAEMLRVVKPGGALHLRCPDYRGTFEGHYLLPWLPLMPRPLARLWLRLHGRPEAGLRGIVYTTQSGLTHGLHQAARRVGKTIVILDLEHARLQARLREKGLPASPLCARAARALLYLRRLFRAETQINLWVSVGTSPGTTTGPASPL